jgi:hypothetical protein
VYFRRSIGFIGYFKLFGSIGSIGFIRYFKLFSSSERGEREIV